MTPLQFTSIKLDLTDEELQALLFQGKKAAEADQALLQPQGGPKEATVTFSHPWTTKEGLEELGKKVRIQVSGKKVKFRKSIIKDIIIEPVPWYTVLSNIPIYEHPVLWRRRYSQLRNKNVIRRMKACAD